jgi:hypothetical protein
MVKRQHNLSDLFDPQANIFIAIRKAALNPTRKTREEKSKKVFDKLS